jgi:hypothetical protein
VQDVIRKIGVRARFPASRVLLAILLALAATAAAAQAVTRRGRISESSDAEALASFQL